MIDLLEEKNFFVWLDESGADVYENHEFDEGVSGRLREEKEHDREYGIPNDEKISHAIFSGGIGGMKL